MANGFGAVGKRGCRHDAKLGSRRIFAPHFKLQVLDSYRADHDCRGNQRATARKYGIHRRQIQKWLQAEAALRGAVGSCREPGEPPRPASPAGPVDLSVRRAPAPAPDPDPAPAPPPRDLGKPGYEPEPPAPPPKSFRLFRPYLPEDNFEQVALAPSSAFERVLSRDRISLDLGCCLLRLQPAWPGLS